MIRARKLPEMRTLVAPVRIACRSELIAHAAKASNSGMLTPDRSSSAKTTKTPAASAARERPIASGAGRAAVGAIQAPQRQTAPVNLNPAEKGKENPGEKNWGG